MEKLKTIVKSMGLVILTFTIVAVSIAFSIFNFVAIGKCGSNCPTLMLERRDQVFEPVGKKSDVWTPLLVMSVVSTVTALANTLKSIPKLKNLKFMKIIIMVLGIATIGVLIWFLAEHYLFWAPSDSDALSGSSRKLFLCGDTVTNEKECKKADNMKDMYLMYYADVITECLFYISCFGAVGGVVIGVILCMRMKKQSKATDGFAAPADKGSKSSSNICESTD